MADQQRCIHADGLWLRPLVRGAAFFYAEVSINVIDITEFRIILRRMFHSEDE